MALAFTYKTAGSVASTPTFTGSGSTHTITNPTVGVSVPTAVTGVAAEYNVTGTAAETTTLVVQMALQQFLLIAPATRV